MEEREKKNAMHFWDANDVDDLAIYQQYSQTSSASGSGFKWGSGSGNCFFNCMACIGTSYNMDYSSQYYQEKYHDGSFWGRGDNVNKEMTGPQNYYRTADGRDIPNPDSAAFISEFFDTKGETWQENTSVIDDYLTQNTKEHKGKVMAVIDTGEKEAHAVILSTVEGGYYTYNDPTSGERDVKISKDMVSYAVKIYGKKK